MVGNTGGQVRTGRDRVLNMLVASSHAGSEPGSPREHFFDDVIDDLQAGVACLQSS